MKTSRVWGREGADGIIAGTPTEKMAPPPWMRAGQRLRQTMEYHGISGKFRWSLLWWLRPPPLKVKLGDHTRRPCKTGVVYCYSRSKIRGLHHC